MKHPVLTGSALITGKKAVVRLADRDVTIEAPSQVLREIFRLCDGQTSLQSVKLQLGARWRRRDIEPLISKLADCRVLVDADELALQSWRYVENPRRLGAEPAAQMARALSLLAASKAARKVARRYRAAPRFGLRSLLERRASVRAFSGKPVALKKVLGMLWAAYGVLALRNGHGTSPPLRRTVSSGGGICPLQLTLVNMRKTGDLNEGVYAAHFRDNQTIGLRPVSVPWRHIFRAFGDPAVLRFAHGVIIVGGDVALTARKYGNRAMLYVPLEAGHAVQNALLAAVEFGVGAVEIGGFIEDQLRRFFRSPRQVLPLSTVVFGEKLGHTGSTAPSPSDDPVATFSWVALENVEPAPPFFLGMVAPTNHRRDADYCWGRSRDPLAAYYKAMAEADEREACTTPTGIYRAAYAELDRALDPREVVSYHPEQYRAPGFPFVPFEAAKRRWWMDGREYFSGRKIPVLADLVYFGDKLRAKSKHPYTTATTSGVAAFTDREGALERAVLELCERDAFMRAWFARKPTPRVERQGLPGHVRRRLADLEKLGLRMVVKNLTRDLVPAVLVFAQHRRKTFTVVGACADYDAELALDHALMEVESSIYLRVQQETARRILPAEVTFSSDHGDLYAQPRYFRRADFLGEGPRQPRLPRKSAAVARTWQELQDRLDEKQLSLIALDLTPAQRKDALIVMRAIIPGLIPISFGFGTEPMATVAQAIPPGARRSPLSMRRRFPHPFA